MPRPATLRVAVAALCLGAVCLGAVCLGSVSASADPKVVEYWNVGNYDEATMLRQLAERFAERTGIRVRIQPVPWGQYTTKYFTAMASGNPPDAGSSSLAAGPMFGSRGGVLDLQQEFPEAVARLERLVFDDIWPTCLLGDKLYAIPLNGTVVLGFYRKDVFAQYGLEAPKTWSQLEGVIEALNAQDRPYGFVWPPYTGWSVGTYTEPFGERPLADRGRRINWTAPGFVRGYSFALRLWTAYDMVLEKAAEQLSVADPARALPMYFSFDLDYTTLLIRAPHLEDKLGIFAFPRADGRKAGSAMGGRTVVIFREAKNPAGAMRWIEFLMSTEAQLFRYRYFRDLGERGQLALSVNREFWEQDLGLGPGHQRVLHQAYAQMRTYPVYPWQREASELLTRSMHKVRGLVEQRLDQVASRHSLSVGQLKREFAQGKRAGEKRSLHRYIETASAEVLANSAKRAQEIADRDHTEYQREALAAATLPTVGSWDVLDLAELAMALLAVGFLLYLLATPSMRRSWFAYLCVAPPVIQALVFVFVPVVVSLYLSFTRYDAVSPLAWAHWVGWDNYLRIFADPVLWQALGRSVYFALIVLPVQLALGVMLAACLDRNLVPDRLYKFVYFAPLVTSAVSVALIWFALLAGAHYGWVNAFLLELGLVADPIDFLNRADLFFGCVIVLAVWQGLAFYILILLAGLQNIPQQQYEAASLDGAGALRQFWHVSLPNLRPQFVFLVIMGTIGAVQVFEQIYMLGGGTGEAGSKFGPDDSGLTMVPFLFRKGFEFLKMGEASAIAYVLFAVLALVTYVNLRSVARGMREQ